MQLTKGLEVEIYTGRRNGEIIGLSDRIVRDLSGFVREPDSRNVEYTTAPLNSYDRLLCGILQPRRQLRQYLQDLDPDYTLIPGSCLALGGTDRFYRSDPQNPYHSYIEQTYGTKVVTASIHINIGIPDLETLIRACRLVRLEAPLYLALSASSPFVGGEVTGFHSSRWQMFPKTPKVVPLFTSHQHFIQWTEAQLTLGTMQNVRHLWSSVRPNGDNRPYSLNRLELRICDLVTNVLDLLAIVALLEARLHQLIQDPTLDPLQQSSLTPTELLALADANEQACAVNSLEAELHRWQNGEPVQARQWIEELYEEVYPYAKDQGFGCFLAPLRRVLRQGNLAQRWLVASAQGQSPATIIQEAIVATETEEAMLAQELCFPLSKAREGILSLA